MQQIVIKVICALDQVMQNTAVGWNDQVVCIFLGIGGCVVWILRCPSNLVTGPISTFIGLLDVFDNYMSSFLINLFVSLMRTLISTGFSKNRSAPQDKILSLFL